MRVLNGKFVWILLNHIISKSRMEDKIYSLFYFLWRHKRLPNKI